MRELAEQAEELMVKRVQELRDEFGMSRSKTYDLEMKEYVARMDRILCIRDGMSGVIHERLSGCHAPDHGGRTLENGI